MKRKKFKNASEFYEYHREAYKKSIDIVYDAYIQGTIECRGGAGSPIGHIIAHSLGIKVKRYFNGSSIYSNWDSKEQPEYLKVTYGGAVRREMSTKYLPAAEKNVAKSGYTLEDVAILDYAFDLHSCGSNSWDAKSIIRGLRLFIKYLADIHKIRPQEKEQTVVMFNKVFEAR